MSTTSRNRQMLSRIIGIIVHGATGRIGATQHLKNALMPIRAEGGLAVGEDRVVPRLDRAIQYPRAGPGLLDRPVNPRIKSGEGDDGRAGIKLIQKCFAAS